MLRRSPGLPDLWLLPALTWPGGLITVLPSGLPGPHDMHVAGNHSSAWNLSWFADQNASTLPAASVVSVSLWVYMVDMRTWALWLADASIGWLRWGCDGWTRRRHWREPVPANAPLSMPSMEPPHDA